MSEHNHPAKCPVVGLPTSGIGLDPRLASLLRDAPVTPVRLPHGDEYAWLVSRYRDIEALTNDARFTRASLGVTVDPPRLTPDFIAPPDAVQRKDPPRSAEIREATAKGINSRRMRGMRRTVQELADRAVTGLMDRDGPVDLVELFAARLPLDVMGRMMDIPEADRDLLRHWTRDLFTIDVARKAECGEAKKGLFGYFGALLQSRRTYPGTDLLSRMIKDVHGSLSDGELLGMTVQLAVIGIAPTNALLADILYVLLTHPGEVTRLAEDAAAIPAFVEEVARYTQVLQGFGPPLVAKQDVPLGGVTIPAGACVVYSYASANRDPEAFVNPDELDFDRKGKKHLMFGAGQHACVGLHFSRAVFEAAVGSLITRMPAVRLTVPADQIDWTTGTVWRHPRELHVVW